MLILLSSKMFGLSVFFFSCITLTRDLFLLHVNSNSLFVGVSKSKAQGGANLNTRVIVRCLIVLPNITFHSIMSIAFLANANSQIGFSCKHNFLAKLYDTYTRVFLFPFFFLFVLLSYLVLLVESGGVESGTRTHTIRTLFPREVGPISGTEDYCELDQTLKRFWEIESYGTELCDRIVCTEEGKVACQQLCSLQQWEIQCCRAMERTEASAT